MNPGAVSQRSGQGRDFGPRARIARTGSHESNRQVRVWHHHTHLLREQGHDDGMRPEPAAHDGPRATAGGSGDIGADVDPGGQEEGRHDRGRRGGRNGLIEGRALDVDVTEPHLARGVMRSDSLQQRTDPIPSLR